LCESISLAGVRVVNREANGSAAYFSASGEAAPFVVAPVIAVQYDPSRLVSDYDDDLIFEQHRQPERIGVERSAACVPAGQDRPDDPQDREDEADQAQHPMALPEAENAQDQQQDKIDDA